jgi:hypothetical protein
MARTLAENGALLMRLRENSCCRTNEFGRFSNADFDIAFPLTDRAMVAFDTDKKAN